MAIQRSSRAIGTPNPLPTILEVNDETGEASLYLNNFGGTFGRVLIATSDNAGNEWTVNNTFRGNWNRNQGLDLNISEFEDLFNTDPGLRKTLNNDRASLINTHSSDDVKKALKEAGVPGVKDPTTGTTTSDTTEVSTTADDSSNQGGDTTTTTTSPNVSIPSLEGGGMPTRKDLRYPIDMSDDMNKLQINIIEYNPKGINTQKGNFQTLDRQKGKVLTSIFLPIPGGISDQNQVSWNKNEMNVLQQAAAELAVAGITGGAKDATDKATEIAKSLGNQTEEAQRLIAGAMAGAASGLGSQLLTRRSGAIINPNAELLFNGPTMRQFGFSFNMSARSDGEAQIINLIIRALKQGMSVRRSQSGLFLLSPHIFELKYLAGSSTQNPHLNKFKTCAMTGLNVNYTPNQTFMALENNMPVAYQVDMQFQELEPIFNDDYTNDNSIGY